MTQTLDAERIDGSVGGWWYPTAAALSANLVGIGLARFGYTPLIPALIAADWFAPSAAVYLGAANLAGYMAGAIGAAPIASRIGIRFALRAAMVLTAASLFACAFPLGFWWFFPWRFLSGATGGMLMALAAPTALRHVPVPRRGTAGGAIFTGVGLGIAASGTLIPLLMRWGLVETWFGLGVLATILTLFAWRGWPDALAPAGVATTSSRRAAATAPLRALYVEYALNAVALVPHMVFTVDYIARGLGRGLHQAVLYWVLFGLGALVGPMAGGAIGDRIGFASLLRLAFIVQAASIALPVVTTAAVGLGVSVFVAGAFVPGIVAITIGRTRELAPGDSVAQTAAWGWCTTAFAIGQAVAGYGFSYLFARSANGYGLLFLIGAAALVVAFAVDIAVGFTMRRRAIRE